LEDGTLEDFSPFVIKQRHPAGEKHFLLLLLSPSLKERVFFALTGLNVSTTGKIQM